MASRFFYLSTCIDGTPVFGVGRTGSLEWSCGGENHSVLDAILLRYARVT